MRRISRRDVGLSTEEDYMALHYLAPGMRPSPLLWLTSTLDVVQRPFTLSESVDVTYSSYPGPVSQQGCWNIITVFSALTRPRVPLFDPASRLADRRSRVRRPGRNSASQGQLLLQRSP